MNIALSSVSQSENVIERIQGLSGAKEQLADPDYWSSVGIISLTGILVVFLILAILIFFFWLMGTIFKAVDKKKTDKRLAAQAPAPVAAPVEAAAAPVEEEEIDDDDEIVAVISAAIAAYAEAEGTSYKVTGIKKHTDRRARSAWSLAGISDNMRQF